MFEQTSKVDTSKFEVSSHSVSYKPKFLTSIVHCIKVQAIGCLPINIVSTRISAHFCVSSRCVWLVAISYWTNCKCIAIRATGWSSYKSFNWNEILYFFVSIYINTCNWSWRFVFVVSTNFWVCLAQFGDRIKDILINWIIANFSLFSWCWTLKTHRAINHKGLEIM